MKRGALVVALLAGCAAPLGDGTSLSLGIPARGLLHRGVALPERSEGLYQPPVWRSRGHYYGTGELVGAIVRAARRVRERHPDAVLYLADLSPKGGGASREHRSHQNGRDADLIFYARTPQGTLAPPPETMPRYRDDGTLRPATKKAKEPPPSARRFDPALTWALVEALLTDPEAEVQWLFISSGLRAQGLEAAHRAGSDPALIEEAEVVLSQPGDSLPHDDHLHLRIYCPGADRLLGCTDFGPVRWLKKHLKGLDLPRPAPAPVAQLMADTTPTPIF